MEKGKKVVILGVFALVITLYFSGCVTTKKVPESKIKVEVIAPQPSLPEKKEERIKKESIAAIKGEPIPLAKIPEEKIFKEVEGELKDILANIHFDFDKSEIKPEARIILTKIASWLQKSPNVYLMIEGHCDERGTEEYNLALGERRALSARRYLVSLGIFSERLNTISYGEAKPLDSGHNEQAWAENRRVHFLISK